jgi:hypothetical protein
MRAKLAVSLLASAALAILVLSPSAQGLSTHELEERCGQSTLEEREECQQTLTQREASEHAEREEHERAEQAAAAERESRADAAIREALEREKHEAAEAERAAKVSKEAKEALAEGGGGACVVLAESPEQGAEVLSRCRTLLAEKIAAAWSKPVSLDIAVETHKGHSTKTPGYTTFRIWVSQFAHVRFTFRRHGRRTYDYVADHPGAGEAVESRRFTVEWSCNGPGGIYQYTVEAWTGKDKEVRHGSFKPVSAKWCRTTAHHEREARTDALATCEYGIAARDQICERSARIAEEKDIPLCPKGEQEEVEEEAHRDCEPQPSG